ncbi:hypothetical protein JAAARDRAFT_39840 [Jaapia argillacea MUCL 33604]|uniref:DUF6533 domain-containing protein n=1 Tax=Jaapia argillacea MUCL 33604 TaxID=933084 RepID=A0A067PRF3_9AGAM|nr:hypothetical protein JAAARDRAFT_39840 [Jaapia argillacea MUCL 33604]
MSTLDLWNTVEGIRITRYCQLAATALAIYDCIITFDQELEQVWKKPWSTSKILFLLSRYYGNGSVIAIHLILLSDTSSNKLCRVMFITQAWANCLAVWIVQIIVQLRVYAMYRRSRYIGSLIVTGFVIEIAAMVTLVTFESVGLEATASPVPGIQLCTVTKIPTFTYGFWLAIMMFECLLFVLALYQAIGRFLKRRDRWRQQSLIDVLLRDNILYFFLIFQGYAQNAAVFTLPPMWIEIIGSFSITWTCTMGCRLILNLRDAYDRRDEMMDTEHIDIRLRELSLEQQREDFRTRISPHETEERPRVESPGSVHEEYELVEVRVP